MLLGVQVTRMEMAKTKEVRRYASLIGSKLASLPRNLCQVLAVCRNRPGFLGSRGGRAEEMVDVVAKGGGLVVGGVPPPLPPVVGDTGSASSSEGEPHGSCAAEAVGKGLCRTGAMEPAGVEGGVWLPEDSAVTSTCTSVVTVP